MSQHYLPLKEEDAKLLHSKLNPVNELVYNDFKIAYRFLHERTIYELYWRNIKSTVNAPIWYYICEALEKKFMNKFYNRIDKIPRFGFDPGGFIALLEGDITEKSSRKSHMISPFFDFSSKESHSIVLVRVQRSERLSWYNQVYHNGWLYDLLNKFTPNNMTLSAAKGGDGDEEELETTMTENEILEKFIQEQNSMNTLENLRMRTLVIKLLIQKSYLLKVPTTRSPNTTLLQHSNRPLTSSGKLCKTIIPKLLTGVPKTYFIALIHVDNKQKSRHLDDKILENLNVYIDDGIEYILRSELQEETNKHEEQTKKEQLLLLF